MVFKDDTNETNCQLQFLGFFIALSFCEISKMFENKTGLSF